VVFVIAGVLDETGVNVLAGGLARLLSSAHDRLVAAQRVCFFAAGSNPSASSSLRAIGTNADP
jgi:hypothetical protein